MANGRMFDGSAINAAMLQASLGATVQVQALSTVQVEVVAP